MNYEKIDLKVLLIPVVVTAITLIILLISNIFFQSKIDIGWYYKVENFDKKCNDTTIYFYKERAIFVVSDGKKKIYKKVLLRSSLDYDEFKTKVLDVDDIYGTIYDHSYLVTLPNGDSKEVNGNNKFINNYIVLTGENYSLAKCNVD